MIDACDPTFPMIPIAHEYNPRGISDFDYRRTWLRALCVDNITEPWQLDVIQEQFINGGANHKRANFIARILGLRTSGITDRSLTEIASLAAKILLKHSRVPRISIFWFPELYAECVLADIAPERVEQEIFSAAMLF